MTPASSPTGGGPGGAGLSAVLCGLRLRDPPGPPAQPHPLLHPRQRNHLDQDCGEVGPAHRQRPQKGICRRHFFEHPARHKLTTSDCAGTTRQKEAKHAEGEGGRGGFRSFKVAFALLALLRGLQVLRWVTQTVCSCCKLATVAVRRVVMTLCPQDPVCPRMT